MIRTERTDGIFQILIDNPPANELGAVASAFLEAIVRAGEDDQVRVVLIRSAADWCFVSSDIGNADQSEQVGVVSTLVDRINDCSKPVVAVINGCCQSAGLELALGCHYRIAGRSAEFSLPAVTLGLLPSAGGTQRLPRLIGMESALDMIVTGCTISAVKALSLGLVDQVADEDELQERALFLARSLTMVRPTEKGPFIADLDSFEAYVATSVSNPAGLEAIDACINAVRAAAELSLADGLAHEHEHFTRLIRTNQARALRHTVDAERQAAEIEGLDIIIPRRCIQKVGIIGAGTMGAGIAMNFLLAGTAVTLVETNEDALRRGVKSVAKIFGGNVVKGRMSEAEQEKAFGLLTPTLDFDDLASCDLIIEAVFEDMAVKLDIFRKLDMVAKPGAILASNTSFLDINIMAQATSRPHDVVGLHFFSPAHIMRLLEIVRADATADDVLATCMSLALVIGKVPVLARVCHGFIGNRMLLPRLDQAKQLLLEGASIPQVDAVSTRLGLPMGPLQMIDLAGVDIGWHRDPSRIETLNDALCASGRLGQKSGAGYYDYDDRRRPISSPETGRIVEQYRATAGMEPREITDDEIEVRTISIMVNEAALILEEAIAQRPGDIDVVWMLGFGWPRWTGGPLWWASQTGLASIVAGLQRYQTSFGPHFRISDLLQDLAAKNETFFSRT